MDNTASLVYESGEMQPKSSANHKYSSVLNGRSRKRSVVSEGTSSRHHMNSNDWHIELHDEQLLEPHVGRVDGAACVVREFRLRTSIGSTVGTLCLCAQVKS